MRTDLSSLDIRLLLRELKILVGGRVQKAFQYGKELRIEVFLSGKGTFELFYSPGKIFVTEYKRQAHGAAEGFAMYFRKHVSGERVVDIRQKDFDRIIEIETDNNIVIFELFSKGNVVICDKEYVVKMPLEPQIWKDRQILPKRPYVYPPSVANPFEMDVSGLSEGLRASGKSLVKFLAVNLSLSGLYAEEVCSRLGVDKTGMAKDFLGIAEKILDTIKSFDGDLAPRIVLSDGKPVDVVPIELQAYDGLDVHIFDTFDTALDHYFTHGESLGMVIEEKKEKDDEIGKIQRIIDDQKAAVEKYKKLAKESQLKAEAIYNNFELVENIIQGLQRAKKDNIRWSEIKERLENEITPEASAVKEIREDDGKVILEL